MSPLFYSFRYLVVLSHSLPLSVSLYVSLFLSLSRSFLFLSLSVSLNLFSFFLTIAWFMSLFHGTGRSLQAREGLTAAAFRHLGLSEPRREPPQFGLFSGEEEA